MTNPARRFENKVFLVTGAGAGICRSAIEIIAAEGGSVAAFDRDAAGLAGTLALIEKAGGKGLAIAGDALAEADAARAVKATVDRFGRIDVLINGVGGSTIVKNGSALLEEFSLEEWESLIDFDLRGTFLFSRGTIPVMNAQKSGKIINMGSICARGTATASAAYSASTRAWSSGNPVCFLASADADFITGVAIDVTGGQ